MNKIIALLALVSILILPSLASAQVKNYCTMAADIKFGDVTYKSGIAVWDPDAGEAPVDPATGDPITCTGTASADCSTVEWGTVCLLNSIARIFNWVFAIMMAIVGIMIIIGAFSIITAGGNVEKVTAGRNYILYAVIGMVVAFFARAIPAIVGSLIR